MGITRRIKFHKNIYSSCYNHTFCKNEFRCKLLVVGGGAGGCSTAWRFSRKLKNNADIIVLEPNENHFYQPLFSLIGAGIKTFPESHRSLKTILPRNVCWVRDKADEFDPCNNVVFTGCGWKIRYDFMVMAVGLVNRYEKIPGLIEVLNDPKAQVSTIYSPEYCQKCWCCMQNFRGGLAIFTYPKQSGKCSGAAQKIMYLAHDYWKKNNILCMTNIIYNTAGDNIYGVPKYADALGKIASYRNIVVNYHKRLTEVNPQGAVFLDKNGESITLPYNFLHVTPAMCPPACLTKCEELINEEGFLHVDQWTLQHCRYHNIYGIGDCTSTPNSKTAAAVACQSAIIEVNLWNTMRNQEPNATYNGYAACPVLTSYKTGILAEFLYDKKICETFPFDQSKERRLFYYLNKEVFPYIYWNKLIKGKWNGPAKLRKILNPFAK